MASPVFSATSETFDSETLFIRILHPAVTVLLVEITFCSNSWELKDDRVASKKVYHKLTHVSYCDMHFS